MAILSSGFAQNMCKTVTFKRRGELQGTLSSEYIVFLYIAARVFLAAIFFYYKNRN